MDASGGPLSPQAPLFTAILADGVSTQSPSVADLLSGFDTLGIAVVRVANPLRSPLTFGRFLMQVAGPDHKPISADDPHQVVQAIIGPERRDQPVVLLIEQAETLHPSMLRVLQSIAPLLAGEDQAAAGSGAELRVILVGRPEFRQLLDTEGLEPLRRMLGFASPSEANHPTSDTTAGSSAGHPVAPATPDADWPPNVPDSAELPSTPRREPSPGVGFEGLELNASASAYPPAHPPGPALPGAPAPRTSMAIPARPVDRVAPTVSSPGGPVAPAKSPIVGPLRAPERPVYRTAAPERSNRFRPLAITIVVLLIAAGGVAVGMKALHGVFYRDVPSRPMATATRPEAVPQAPAPAQPNPDPPSTAQNGVPPAVPPLAELPSPAPPVTNFEPAAPSVPTTPLEAVPPSVATMPPAEPFDRAARLRRDFQDFLDRSGQNVAGLSDAQRSDLFDEYVAWSARNSQAPTGPRIVLHVPSGAAASALGARLAATLGPQPGTVETRQVTNSPNRPNIRFFHPSDAAAARQTAAWLSDAGLRWEVRDFSGAQTRASPGTIEVWLPAQP